jgi:hypothetical protein
MYRGLGEFVKMICKAWLITINFIHNVAINYRICLTFFGVIYIYILPIIMDVYTNIKMYN